jgi:hypothetical protein
MQRQPQEVDGFRALSAAFTRMSLREPTELNQLGFGRLKSETKLPQPKAQRVLNADGGRSILETDHKVIDIAHQSGFAATGPLPRVQTRGRERNEGTRCSTVR